MRPLIVVQTETARFMPIEKLAQIFHIRKTLKEHNFDDLVIQKYGL